MATEPDRLRTLISALQQEDRNAKRMAIDALGEMGEAAADATPALLDLMEQGDEGITARVWSALRKIGFPAVPYLVKGLQSKNASRRLHATEALDKMGAPAAAAIDVLTTVAIGDTEQDNREAAIYAISHTGDKKAVPALITAVKRGDDVVRWRALEELGNFGAQAKPALDVFVDQIGQPGLTGAAAARGLAELGDEDAAAALAKVLSNRNKSVVARDNAAFVLRRMPSQVAITVPALVGASTDSEEVIRAEVVATLRELGATARQAAPALRLMLSDPVPNIRITAALALYAVRGSDREAVNSLVNESRSCQPSERELAVYALGEVGENEWAAVEALIAHLADEAPRVRKTAARALGTVGRPAALPAIPQLEKLLDDSDADVRAAAKKALTDLKPK
jgi:HEAT repeat protein